MSNTDPAKVTLLSIGAALMLVSVVVFIVLENSINSVAGFFEFILWAFIVCPVLFFTGLGLLIAGSVRGRRQQQQQQVVVVGGYGAHQTGPPAGAWQPIPGRTQGPLFCASCGARLSPGNRFCTGCGRPS